ARVAPGAEPLDEVERRRDGEPCRGIARSGPRELGIEAYAEIIRDHRRMQFALPALRRHEKTRALRCAQPLVTVADVPVGAGGERIVDDERQLSGRVCAVD